MKWNQSVQYIDKLYTYLKYGKVAEHVDELFEVFIGWNAVDVELVEIADGDSRKRNCIVHMRIDHGDGGMRRVTFKVKVEQNGQSSEHARHQYYPNVAADTNDVF
jgi:hypothetical protein